MVRALAGQQQEVVLTRVRVQQRAVVEAEVNNQGHGSLTDHVMLLSLRTHAPSSILSRVSSSEGTKTPTHTRTHARTLRCALTHTHTHAHAAAEHAEDKCNDASSFCRGKSHGVILEEANENTKWISFLSQNLCNLFLLQITLIQNSPWGSRTPV